MRIKLVRIDLSKCANDPKEGGTGTYSYHPAIHTRRQYLARINGKFYAGRFTREWYGYNFDTWENGVGIQLDKPGTNASMWQDLWEIRKCKTTRSK